MVWAEPAGAGDFKKCTVPACSSGGPDASLRFLQRAAMSTTATQEDATAPQTQCPLNRDALGYATWSIVSAFSIWCSLALSSCSRL